MKGANIPSYSDLNQYAVNRGGEYEGIRQSLYDFQTYPTAGQTTQTFFQVPVGQGGKTLADTNMETAGTLPAPKHFLVQSIEIYYFSGTDIAAATTIADEVSTIGESGSLDFFIGSKSYLQEAPLQRFPPKCVLDTDLGGNAAEYAAFGGRPYFIDPWILLTPTQNFNVKLSWPTAVPTGDGDGRIGIVLDGILYRLSQ